MNICVFAQLKLGEHCHAARNDIVLVDTGQAAPIEPAGRECIGANEKTDLAPAEIGKTLAKRIIGRCKFQYVDTGRVVHDDDCGLRHRLAVIAKRAQ